MGPRNTPTIISDNNYDHFIPLHLSKEEKKALVSFLRDGLSGPPIKINPPKIP